MRKSTQCGQIPYGERKCCLWSHVAVTFAEDTYEVIEGEDLKVCLKITDVPLGFQELNIRIDAYPCEFRSTSYYASRRDAPKSITHRILRIKCLWAIYLRAALLERVGLVTVVHYVPV